MKATPSKRSDCPVCLKCESKLMKAASAALSNTTAPAVQHAASGYKTGAGYQPFRTGPSRTSRVWAKDFRHVETTAQIQSLVIEANVNKIVGLSENSRILRLPNLPSQRSCTVHEFPFLLPTARQFFSALATDLWPSCRTYGKRTRLIGRLSAGLSFVA